MAGWLHDFFVAHLLQQLLIGVFRGRRGRHKRTVLRTANDASQRRGEKKSAPSKLIYHAIHLKLPIGRPRPPALVWFKRLRSAASPRFLTRFTTIGIPATGDVPD
jgi:hypothetical protein